MGGDPKLLLARPGSSMLSTMLATTSWSEPRPSSRTPSWSSMPLPSDSGMRLTTRCPWEERRVPSSLMLKKLLSTKRGPRRPRPSTPREKESKVEAALLDQFMTGRVLASISSRPGQCGRSDGYVLEGKELEFYLRKIKAKRGR